MPGENTSKNRFVLSESSLRGFIRRFILESDHKWSRANDSILMLDQEGMEKTDKDNVSRFLKAMGMID